MSDNPPTTNECTSCQLFLRVGIPVVVVFLIIVIGCIVWFDRYDKYRLQKKLQEKRDKKLQAQQNQQKYSSEENSFDSSSNEETDLSIYTLPSRSIVNSTERLSERSNKDNSNDLDNIERGRTDKSNPPNTTTKDVVVPSPYRVQRFHALIQQVHDENIKHLPTIVQTINEEMIDADAMYDGDDQSSIESDVTPIVANNNNNSTSQQVTNSETPPVHLTTTFIVQLPPCKDLATHSEIGLIRNNLSIPGTTESESTSSSSSSTSSSTCRSNSDAGAHGTYDIAV